MDFWQVLPVAVALVFVLEGMLPFLSPERYREMLALVARMDSPSIRRFGLVSMLLGVTLLYLVH